MAPVSSVPAAQRALGFLPMRALSAKLDGARRRVRSSAGFQQEPGDKMFVRSLLRGAWLAMALVLAALQAQAADFPAPKRGTWVVRDFKFHTGETLPELKLHYQTVGEPT